MYVLHMQYSVLLYIRTSIYVQVEVGMEEHNNILQLAIIYGWAHRLIAISFGYAAPFFGRSKIHAFFS